LNRISPVTRLQMGIARKGLDAFLVTSQYNRFYLSGFSAKDMGIEESAGALLVLCKERYLLTDGRFAVQAREECQDWPVVVYKKGLAEGIKSVASDFSLKSLGYEPNFITCEVLEGIKKALPKLEPVPIKGTVEKMREKKRPWEVERIKKAVSAAENVIDEVWRSIRPGQSEKEIAFMILKGLYEEAEGPSFPPIVASGPNSALPHAEPTSRKIKEGEPLIIDMGAIYKGYCSDMTRTLFVGKRPEGIFTKIYQIVAQAKQKAQAAIKAGVVAKEVDLIARQEIKDWGYGKEFVHSLGHGVGLAVHEPPTLSSRNRKKLRAGNVITVEPGIYIAGKGGVRLEDMVLVTENGSICLNSNKWYYPDIAN